MSDTQPYDFNSVYIIRFLLKYKWPLLIVTAIAIIASAVFSGPYFVRPKYESTVVFYPTANNTVSGAVLEDAFEKDRDAQEFGEEFQAEQALQILASGQLMGRVVERFHLMEHYEIDPKGAMPYTKLGHMIKSNISFSRTEYTSIEIKVKDYDPKMAANIANGISEAYDSVRIDIQRQVSRKAFDILEREYQMKVKEVELLQQQMDDISKGGNANDILSMSGKTKGQSTTQLLEKQNKIAGKGGNIGTILTLSESIRLQVEQRENLRRKYEKAKADLEEFLPQKFEISRAEPAETKAYPVRWVIVVVATFSTFIFSLLLLLFIDWYNHIRPQLKD